MLTLDNIQKILGSAKAVYWAYLCLEFANQPLQAEEQSLAEQVRLAIKNKQAASNITLGGKPYTLRCTLQSTSADTYQVTLTEEKSRDASTSASDLKITNLKEYTLTDKQTLLKARTYTARLDPVTDTYVLGTPLTYGDKQLEIGGPDKISLYASHIANLGTFIDLLETNKSKKQTPAMLAALATGSGKSFTQALWILILHLADVKGIFAAPAALIKQLEKDVRRLLPQQVTREIELAEAKEAKELKSSGAKPFRIVSYDTLFSSAFADTMSASFSPENTLLSFDEQHIISAREDWAVKLGDLVKKYNALFLTATPTRSTFKLSGEKTAVSMSRKQKEKAGYAVPAENIQRLAPLFKDKIDASNQRWFYRQLYKLLSLFANALVAEVVSPVDEMIRHAKYSFVAKPKEMKGQSLRHYLRWNISIPAADKMLIVTHDHDTLINLSRGLQDQDITQSIYHDGTLVQRRNIYNLFKIDNIEDEITREYEEENRKRFESQLKEQVTRAGYSLTDSKDGPTFERYRQQVAEKKVTMQLYAKRIIFTGVVNQALRVLTGYDLITLDKMRFEDLYKLAEEVRAKAKAWKDTPDSLAHQFKEEGLDPPTAQKLADDAFRIIQYLKGEADSNHLIDNWVLEADQNCEEIFGSSGFDWESHYTRFTFQGLEKNHEEEVEDGRVYSSFHETAKRLRTADGSFDPTGKKRQHNAIEIFKEDIEEYSYSPVPSEEKMTVDQLKAAFKMGLIPFMVSNSMVEGFNDPDLHVTVNLVAKTHDLSNQPAKIIQASGRNRGLNKHRTPIYMQVHNTGVETLFSLRSLDKDDYVPDFLSSTSRYNQKILDSQGKKLANKVKQWIQEHAGDDGSVDAEQLKNYIFTLAKDSILALNVGNDHDLEKSRQQFVTVLDSVQKELSFLQYKVRNTYELSYFVSFIGNIINWIAKLAYRSYKNTAYVALCAHVRSHFADDSKESQQARLYQKVVGRDLALMQKNGMVFQMLGNLLTSQATKIKAEIDRDEKIVVNEEAIVKSIKRNLCQALKSAKSAKKPECKEFNNKCDELIRIVKSQKDEEVATDEKLTLPIVQEKMVDFLAKNPKTQVIFATLSVEEKTIIAASLTKKIDNNSVQSDAKATLGIQKCKGYELLKELVYNPVFLEILATILDGYSNEELQLFLPRDLSDDAASTRIQNLKFMLNDLRAMHQGRASMTPDDFDNKYLKFLRTMDNSRQILEDARNIFRAQLDCHLHFHQIGDKGEHKTQAPPTLIHELGLNNATLTVQRGGMGKIAYQATHAFFLKAIKDSLPSLNSLNAIVLRKQAGYLSDVSEDIIRPLRSALHNGWRWRYFGKITKKTQHDSAEFADRLKESKPLDTATAQTREHCFSHLKIR